MKQAEIAIKRCITNSFCYLTQEKRSKISLIISDYEYCTNFDNVGMDVSKQYTLCYTTSSNNSKLTYVSSDLVWSNSSRLAF